MPVKRRIGKHRRRGWEFEHYVALEKGHRFFGVFNEMGEWDMDEARAAWGDLREEIMERWAREHPCHRPWAWWVIDMGLEYPWGASRERRYLHEHGHLSEAEVAMIEADPSLLELKPYGHDSR